MSCHLFFFLIIPPPPSSTLFPYTTLFRSIFAAGHPGGGDHDRAGAISGCRRSKGAAGNHPVLPGGADVDRGRVLRSEEHTSELQSHVNLVCRLLLEKKKKIRNRTNLV